jgi:hypothetical protein
MRKPWVATVSITLFKRDVKPRLWRYNMELSCAAASVQQRIEFGKAWADSSGLYGVNCSVLLDAPSLPINSTVN